MLWCVLESGCEVKQDLTYSESTNPKTPWKRSIILGYWLLQGIARSSPCSTVIAGDRQSAPQLIIWLQLRRKAINYCEYAITRIQYCKMHYQGSKILYSMDQGTIIYLQHLCHILNSRKVVLTAQCITSDVQWPYHVLRSYKPRHVWEISVMVDNWNAHSVVSWRLYG